MRMRRSVSGWKIIIIKRKCIRNVRIIFASCSFKRYLTLDRSHVTIVQQLLDGTCLVDLWLKDQRKEKRTKVIYFSAR